MTQSERVLMIRNKTKMMKIALPDGSLRTHRIDMTLPVFKLMDKLADQLGLPHAVRREYSIFVEFDKESRQIELALNYFKNSKSFLTIKNLICPDKQHDEQFKKVRTPIWLDTSRTVAELEPLINNRLIHYKRRFAFTNLELDAKNNLLVYVQFKEAVTQVKVLGSVVKISSIGLVDAAKLVAIMSKLQKGENSDKLIHKTATELFPNCDVNAILQVLAAKQGAGEIKIGLDEFTLQCDFVKIARALPGFGDSFFPAKDAFGKDALLAVSRISVSFYRDGKLDERYPFERIRRWMAIPEKRLFTMEVDDGPRDLAVLQWYTSDSSEIQQLLDGYVQLTLISKTKSISNSPNLTTVQYFI